MWHTSEKVKTFAGAFSFLLAHGLDDMLEHLEDCYECEDYDIRTFEDGPPDLDAQKRKKFGIDDDYFSAIPDDPKPAEAKKLLREARKLCDRVIKREKKKQHKG